MKKLKRLPNGYKRKVNMAKETAMIILAGFREQGMSFDDNVTWLKNIKASDGNQIYTNIETWKFNGIKHIYFRIGVVALEIMYCPKTNKYKLSDTCNVFKEGTEDYLEKYRW